MRELEAILLAVFNTAVILNGALQLHNRDFICTLKSTELLKASFRHSITTLAVWACQDSELASIKSCLRFLFIEE